MKALAEVGVACDASRLPSARASVAEGFFAVTIENERTVARRAWDYPACAVRVSSETVAVVAGYPADDGEALADWSARTALAISREGYKHAVIAGSEPARAELTQALSLLGVALAPATAEPKGWLSSLLKR